MKARMTVENSIREAFNTNFAVSVVVVEDAKGDGRKDAGKVEEQRRRQDLLRCLDTGQPVFVVGDVVRKTS